MKPFSVALTRAAAKDLDDLPAEARAAVIEELQELRLSPLDRPPRVKRLRGFRYALYRLRCRDHRILYRIDGGTVTTLRVIDRKDLERTLRRLRPILR